MGAVARSLLVTTALESTWGTDEHLVFLGEWCKRYERRDAWSRRCSATVPFHWDDRAKLARDYDYLQDVHASLLRGLARALNDLHRIDESVRYWQILLDPWLMAFVGSVWDRWECLRAAFADHGRLDTIVAVPDVDAGPPGTYAEFIQQVAFTEEWNHDLCARIIAFEYAADCTVRKVTRARRLLRSAPRRSVTAAIAHGALAAADQLFGLVAPKVDVAFVAAYFDAASQARLNLALGQAPRSFDSVFEADDAGSTAEAPRRNVHRAELRSSAIAGSRFEQFIATVMPEYVPRSVVEDFGRLRQRARRLRLRPKVIVTANSHWSNAQVKAWMAERTSAGAKLVILEHGGSLPARRELFDFEEDISNVRGTWFVPYHPKHIQVPPSKLVSVFQRREAPRARGRHLVVIGNEYARYVHRAHFYPMAAQCLVSLQMVLDLAESLDDGLRPSLRVKPQADQGWNTRQRLIDALGQRHVLDTPSIRDAFRQARLIVCTYPETTFTEAMVSDIPTMMLYPDELYERNAIAYPLMGLLRSANIVFHDPARAAAHANAIWRDPDGWWNTATVLEARAEFQRQAANLSGDWVTKWKSFLQRVEGDA